MATTPPPAVHRPRSMKAVGFALTLFVVVVSGWLIIRASRKEPPAPATAEAGAPSTARTVEALVLEHECWTPCSATIEWPSRVERYGQPLEVRWPGVARPVVYTGTGDTRAPTGMRSGEVQFTSPDAINPHVRVRVYRRITVPSGER